MAKLAWAFPADRLGSTFPVTSCLARTATYRELIGDLGAARTVPASVYATLLWMRSSQFSVGIFRTESTTKYFTETFRASRVNPKS
jgi:hypothetical protein